MKRLTACASLVVLFSSAWAQDYRHTDQVQVLTDYGSLEQWLGRADQLRTHILVSAGMWPMPLRKPLNPQVGAPIERGDYSVQAVALETWPEFYLVGNLYRPLGKKGPHPAILSAHGHWKPGRLEDSELASVPGRAINFAKMGFVVFTYSMIGYNEMAPFMEHRFEATKSRQIWGFSPMGLQLWNSTRALDFLLSLPDVDSSRVGMTGASGGGTQTFLLTAVDDRIKAAAPVNMISAHFQGGCVCENGPLLRIACNNVEIGGLTAPRPLLMISTSGDWTKNTPQIEFPAMRRIYRLFGAEDRVANVHLDYPHNYNKDSREAVYTWFSRLFLGTGSPVKEQPFKVEEASKLEAVLPRTPVNVETLQNRIAAQADRQIEDACPANWADILAYRETFGTALTHVLETGGAKLKAKADLIPLRERTAGAPAVLVVHPGGARTEARVTELTEAYVGKGWLVFTLRARPEDHDFQPPAKIQHWTTYNPTPVALAIAEIRRAMDEVFRRPDARSLDVIGVDTCGPLVWLARACESRVRQTIIDFPYAEAGDACFADNLFIPVIRRAGDFRTAAVMAAPGALTIHGLRDQKMRLWLQRVYRAAGASDMLKLD